MKQFRSGNNRERKTARFLSAVLFLACLFVPLAVSAAGAVKCYGIVDDAEQAAVVYVPETLSADGVSVIIGTDEVTGAVCTPVKNLDVPCETVILLDNSLSIPESMRPAITGMIEGIFGNRMNGEQFTLATYSDTVTYLCQNESDYITLVDQTEKITYQKQKTQLIDCLYQVLDDLDGENSTNLKRIILITDGTEHDGLGYTREELNSRITELHIPIYAIGCLSADANENAVDDLENLFAIARLTGGDTLQLQSSDDVNSALQMVSAWNSATQVRIPIPAALCDGLEKKIEVSDGSVTESITLDMPQVAVQEQTQESSTVAETTADPEPAASPAGDTKSTIQATFLKYGPYIAIAAGVILAVTVPLVLRGGQSVKKNRKKTAAAGRVNRVNSYNNAANKAAPSGDVPTAFQKDDSGVTQIQESGDDALNLFGPGREKIWTLVLVNEADPSIRLEHKVEGMVSIGRQASTNDMVTPVSMASISRRQCKVVSRDGGLWLSNVTERKTTYLDGVQVTGEVRLRTGAILELGGNRERFHVELI